MFVNWELIPFADRFVVAPMNYCLRSGRRFYGELASGAAHVGGRKVAWVPGAPLRDALREILRDDAKRALGCAVARAWYRPYT
jgi:hypothetical protein